MSTGPDAAAVRGQVERWRRECAKLQTLLNVQPVPPALAAEAFALHHECSSMATRLRAVAEQGAQRRHGR